MDNKSDLPEGWAMPDDQARQVRDELNKKPLTPEVMLQDALYEFARDIALIEPNPVDWGGWLIYLIEQMEAEAEKKYQGGNFKVMLKTLSKDILSITD